ncbi:ATP synthase F1 subunit gamma [Pseudobdellovibrio exovorus]|uniref:ATP synthase gamma chain n=1 Tax=Pseudobdellovibrio exovorus JSS TaxID=1184267 RepID=M4VC58_9BACT|nr:ATP synthase F1 subunit gamma [Pseudobdellovibrio exovorus]AGH96823.1 ATP synthase gamma chain [Pseudobdellovibrio exovorus JSS]
MASLKDIRLRIESTKNTQQITKAMKLVSAAKLRKAQHNITNMRPYAITLKGVIANIAATQKVSHPLMTKKESVRNVLLVVLTSDRGLCGGFNSNINKFADRYLADNKHKYEKIDFIFIGKRGADFFARKKVTGIENITKLDKDISYDMAKGIAENLIAHYQDGNYDEIRLIYNEFKSAISQKVVCETLLPVELEKSSFEGTNFAPDMIFDPSPEAIIEELLKKNFNLQVYRAMSESVASEHGARMTAMENASNNARDMINKLTLTYNKLRQEKITTELTEIVSGAESLKG